MLAAFALWCACGGLRGRRRWILIHVQSTEARFMSESRHFRNNEGSAEAPRKHVEELRRGRLSGDRQAAVAQASGKKRPPDGSPKPEPSYRQATRKAADTTHTSRDPLTLLESTSGLRT